MTYDDFEKILAKGHLYRTLFHFTAKANLPSIAKNGIASKEHARKKNIKISVRGGNEWSQDADALKGLNDYVNLCFTQNHPMCYVAEVEGRIADPIYLAISPKVLRIKGVKITLGVANKSGVELLELEKGLAQIDTQVLYTRTDWGDPKIQARLRNAEKCEILVPRLVPPELILTKI